MLEIENHKQLFSAYVHKMRSKMVSSTVLMDLKYKHSLNVLEHAIAISEQVIASSQKSILRMAKLAALYHDIGRFEQVLRWGTFLDSKSVNHGLLGAKVLKAEKTLINEPFEVKVNVIAAVAMHNRFVIPEKLAPDLALITNIVRDADKLDIIRVMAAHFKPNNDGESEAVTLYAKDDPDLFSPIILENALAGQMASYSDIKSINDFKVLMGTWIYSLNFEVSRKVLKKNGLLAEVLEILPLKEPFGSVRAHLLAKLEAF